MLLAEVLIKNPKLTRFCKVKISEVSQLEAVFLKKLRWNKSEEERKKKAAEDALKEQKNEE